MENLTEIFDVNFQIRNIKEEVSVDNSKEIYGLNFKEENSVEMNNLANQFRKVHHSVIRALIEVILRNICICNISKQNG